MSQEEVFHIVKLLGGKATTKEVTDYARKNYPNYSLYMYIGRRLRKLAEWGYLKRTNVGAMDSWEIIKEYKG